MAEDNRTAIDDAAGAIADKLNARVVAYSGYIDHPAVGNLLMEIYREEDKRENTFLILTTIGGDADAAYRIARIVQLISKKFYLCVPRMCKSAGTLIALGANEIVMNPFAELGPLDVQLVQRDEIEQSRSGLVVDTALEGLAEKTRATFQECLLSITYGSDKAISFEAASKVAATLATGVMAPIYAQIRPGDLGNDRRNLEIAKAYGQRLIRHSRNAKRDAISRLVHKYPSHSFIIDSEEAETLFRNVTTRLHNHVMALFRELPQDPGKRPAYVSRLDPKEESSEQKDASAKPDAPGTSGGGKSTGAESGRARRSPGKENSRGNREEAGATSSAPDKPSGSR